MPACDVKNLMKAGTFQTIREEVWAKPRNYGYKLACGHYYYSRHRVSGAFEVECEECVRFLRDEIIKVMDLPRVRGPFPDDWAPPE